MTTFTTSLRLALLTPGDPSVKNAWGPPLNTNDILIDSAINGTAIISVAGQTSVTLTVANGAADQSRELVQQFTDAPGGNCTVSIPNVPKYGWAQNNTIGGFNIILTAGAGTDATIPPDRRLYFYSCDGATNVVLPAIGFGSLNVSGGIEGVQNGSNAVTGTVGEYLSNQVSGTTPLAITSDVSTNILSLLLSPGDWDVSGNIGLSFPSGSNSIIAAISTIAATIPGAPAGGALYESGGPMTFFSVNSLGTLRVNVSTNTSVFLVARATFTGTGNAFGFIGARRMR